MNNNKHNEFAESMRSIMINEEQKQKEKRKNTEKDDESSQNLQEILEIKYHELFGFDDEEDD